MKYFIILLIIVAIACGRETTISPPPDLKSTFSVTVCGSIDSVNWTEVTTADTVAVSVPIDAMIYRYYKIKVVGAESCVIGRVCVAINDSI
jgi:hypothetical protein